MYSQALINQLKEIEKHPEYLRYQQAFLPWFIKDINQHAAAYQPTIDRLCRQYPEIRQLWRNFRQCKPRGWQPRQIVFDTMIDAVYEVAKKRMPAELITLERAANAVIPNARRN